MASNEITCEILPIPGIYLKVNNLQVLTFLVLKQQKQKLLGRTLTSRGL